MRKRAYSAGRRSGVFAALIWIVASCASDDVPDRNAPDSPEIADQRANVPAAFSLYRNDRFGYAVAYPDTLLNPRGESQNGDGQQFVSPDSSVVLTAFGRNLYMEDSVDSIFDQRIQRRQEEAGLVIFSEKADSAFVIRGTSGERIYFEKSIFYDDRMATIELTYPIRMRAYLDSVVAHVSDSFGEQI